MKAMILAAGRGERMMPLTSNTAKPLLQVAGKGLIEYHLQNIAKAGIKDVVVNVCWCAEQVMAVLGDGSAFQLNISYSVEPEALETGGAIWFAAELLGGSPFMLVNGDIFTDFPLRALRHIQLDGDRLAHLVLVPNPDHHPHGDYALTDTGLLLEKDSRQDNCGYTFSGLSLIHPQLLNGFCEQGIKFPLREVFHTGISQRKITGELYTGQWTDVGTPERLRTLDKYLLGRAND